MIRARGSCQAQTTTSNGTGSAVILEAASRTRSESAARDGQCKDVGGAAGCPAQSARRRWSRRKRRLTHAAALKRNHPTAHPREIADREEGGGERQHPLVSDGRHRPLRRVMTSAWPDVQLRSESTGWAALRQRGSGREGAGPLQVTERVQRRRCSAQRSFDARLHDARAPRRAAAQDAGGQPRPPEQRMWASSSASSKTPAPGEPEQPRKLRMTFIGALGPGLASSSRDARIPRHLAGDRGTTCGWRWRGRSIALCRRCGTSRDHTGADASHMLRLVDGNKLVVSARRCVETQPLRAMGLLYEAF